MRSNERRVAKILVDGRSGSGKTEFAAGLARACPEAQLVRLDDIYPGWDGLEAGSAHVSEQIFAHNRWRRWDWLAGEPAEWHVLDPHQPLIVEGCGALSRQNRSLATFGVWVDLDDAERKSRALARDGKSYAPHWERWARQEVQFIAREAPEAQADAILDGRQADTAADAWLERVGLGGLVVG